MHDFRRHGAFERAGPGLRAAVQVAYRFCPTKVRCSQRVVEARLEPKFTVEVDGDGGAVGQRLGGRVLVLECHDGAHLVRGRASHVKKRNVLAQCATARHSVAFCDAVRKQTHRSFVRPDDFVHAQQQTHQVHGRAHQQFNRRKVRVSRHARTRGGFCKAVLREVVGGLRGEQHAQKADHHVDQDGNQKRDRGDGKLPNSTLAFRGSSRAHTSYTTVTNVSFRSDNASLRVHPMHLWLRNFRATDTHARFGCY